MIRVFFVAAAVFGLTGLCTLAIDVVPRVLGTTAFVVTLAAIALAITH